ncbi:hypothetical protein [Microbispora sp. GKU 823]|uniref:hypothetical protein n=1 Tax=Microbispora sp. GKU 823 TaxID=1652100 RepID=UPI0015C456E7|nr:hypothetical protein [Microbispora sp. GKU 823]
MPRIRLTQEGRTAITAVVDREREVFRQVGGDLSGDEVDACIRVLSHLLQSLDNVEIE